MITILKSTILSETELLFFQRKSTVYVCLADIIETLVSQEVPWFTPNWTMFWEKAVGHNLKRAENFVVNRILIIGVLKRIYFCTELKNTLIAIIHIALPTYFTFHIRRHRSSLRTLGMHNLHWSVPLPFTAITVAANLLGEPQSPTVQWRFCFEKFMQAVNWWQAEVYRGVFDRRRTV